VEEEFGMLHFAKPKLEETNVFHSDERSEVIRTSNCRFSIESF
jgi:hypothetical protein